MDAWLYDTEDRGDMARPDDRDADASDASESMDARVVDAATLRRVGAPPLCAASEPVDARWPPMADNAVGSPVGSECPACAVACGARAS